MEPVRPHAARQHRHQPLVLQAGDRDLQDHRPWTVEFAAAATFYAGGRTTFNGVLKADLQQNWRVGATYAIPIDRLNSIKLYASSGLSDRL